MNEWTATIWASISAMMAALVLTLIVVLGSMARESAQIQHEEDNAIAIVKEQRQYLLYNEETALLPQDVISAIAESRGFPEIRVDIDPSLGDDFALVWNTSTPLTEFATSRITDHYFDSVPNSARYYGKLVKDANGVVVAIEFGRR